MCGVTVLNFGCNGLLKAYYLTSYMYRMSCPILGDKGEKGMLEYVIVIMLKARKATFL